MITIRRIKPRTARLLLSFVGSAFIAVGFYQIGHKRGVRDVKKADTSYHIPPGEKRAYIFTDGDSTSLQKAINRAENGDYVVVNPGVWELTNSFFVPSNRGLTVSGWPGHTTTLVMPKTGDPAIILDSLYRIDPSYCSMEAFPWIEGTTVQDFVLDWKGGGL